MTKFCTMFAHASTFIKPEMQGNLINWSFVFYFIFHSILVAHVKNLFEGVLVVPK